MKADGTVSGSSYSEMRAHGNMIIDLYLGSIHCKIKQIKEAFKPTNSFLWSNGLRAYRIGVSLFLPSSHCTRASSRLLGTSCTCGGPQPLRGRRASAPR